jgi:neutral/alkaline ceramidase-like enzyme
VLRAGFAKLDISARTGGARLVGYPQRSQRATARHDPLCARAMVLEDADRVAAICSVELCYVGEDVVREARDRIAETVGIPEDAVLVCATHTHSGPHDVDPACWPDGLAAQICAAVAGARDRVAPARIGAGWGMVHGHSLNRRRLEDPIDPAILVMRVDDLDGRLLGVVYSFACHPAVLGPDNALVCGDWPGFASRALEGPGVVAVFLQGACADVNPLTAGVRAMLGAGRAIAANAPGAHYYGPASSGTADARIGDRTGGTFAEADRLGAAVADEAARVCAAISTRPVAGMWTRSIAVPGLRDPGRPADSAPPPFGRGLPAPRSSRAEPFEIMLFGLDGPGVLLVGQPGEAFARTGVGLRRELRGLGLEHACVVGYANGWRGYLPAAEVFGEGGYEVEWARGLGVPPGLQDTIRRAVVDAVAARRLSPSPPRPCRAA